MGWLLAPTDCLHRISRASCVNLNRHSSPCCKPKVLRGSRSPRSGWAKTFFSAGTRTPKPRSLKLAQSRGAFTLAELQILVAQNRIAPLSDDELRKSHRIKRTFDARIAK